MELRLLFTLIAFLGGAWVYLLQLIISLTIASPANPELMPLAFAHFVVAVYLSLSLVIFFWQGMAVIGYQEPVISRHASRLVFGTWPVTLVALIVALAVAKFDIPGQYKAFIFTSPIVGLSFAFLARIHSKRSSTSAEFPVTRWIVELVALPTFVIVAFVPYVMAMSLILSDVEVSTDKMFYTVGDIIVSIRRGGYVFCPEVKVLECGAFRLEPADAGTYVIPLEEAKGADYILVEYEPQMSWGIRRHFESLRIARRLQ
jgi:hypothetical protein